MKRICCIIIVIILTLASIGDILYVSRGNIFDGFFTEAYEKCAWIMYNGEVYVFTTMDDGYISGQLSVWIEEIEKDGLDISDVAIVMHNHFASPRFSDADKNTYTRLKMYGFSGGFGVYVTATNKVYLLEDRK